MVVEPTMSMYIYGHCLNVCNCKHFNTYNPRGTSVVIYTDLSGKELHSQVGMGRLMISGNIADVIVSTLFLNARDVGSIPVVGAIFSTLLTPTTLQ